MCSDGSDVVLAGGNTQKPIVGNALGSVQKVLTMTSQPAGMTLAPLTDIVLPGNEEVLEELFDRRTRKLIAVLHRRFWEKRRKMLQDRAIHGDVITLTSSNSSLNVDERSQPVREFGEVIADLRQASDSWDGRLDEYLALRDAMASRDFDDAPLVVRVRGWGVTDPGILVDGRAVAGCIVDVAVALSQAAHIFRDGEEAFVLDVADAMDAGVARLWADLMCLAHDRSGIDRGTVTYGSLHRVQRDGSCDDSEVAVA